VTVPFRRFRGSAAPGGQPGRSPFRHRAGTVSGRRTRHFARRAESDHGPRRGQIEGRPQLRPNVLACETCCPRGRNRAGAPKNRSNEPFLRAKEIAAR